MSRRSRSTRHSRSKSKKFLSTVWKGIVHVASDVGRNLKLLAEVPTDAVSEWSRAWREYRRAAGQSKLPSREAGGKRPSLWSQAVEAWTAVRQPAPALPKPATSKRRAWQRLTFWLAAAPSLLAVAGLLSVSFTLTRQSSVRLATSYTQAAREALDAHDFRTARVALDRLMGLRPDDPWPRFALAEIYEATGETARAEALMNRLAPATASGYGPAHLWIARRLVPPDRIPVEQAALARMHLARAVQLLPKDDEARILLVRVLLTLGQAADAEPHLLLIVDRHPEWQLTLARVLDANRKPERAREMAARAAKFYAQQWAKDPANESLCRHAAEASILAHDWAGAIEVLEQGQQAHDSPALRAALAETLVRWAQVLEGEPNGAPRAWEQRERARGVDPWNAALVDYLIRTAAGGGFDAARARGMLDGMLAAGEPTADAHYVLGTAYWDFRQLDLARTHLEAAYRLAPTRVDVANNLAWALAHSPPEQLDRALEIMNRALEAHPGQPNLLDTRGHVLAKLGRHQEAVNDLELSVSVLVHKSPTHAVLADCYEKLGLLARAEVHRGLAKQTALGSPAVPVP